MLGLPVSSLSLRLLPHGLSAHSSTHIRPLMRYATAVRNFSRYPPCSKFIFGGGTIGNIGNVGNVGKKAKLTCGPSVYFPVHTQGAQWHCRYLHNSALQVDIAAGTTSSDRNRNDRNDRNDRNGRNDNTNGHWRNRAWKHTLIVGLLVSGTVGFNKMALTERVNVIDNYDDNSGNSGSSGSSIISGDSDDLSDSAKKTILSAKNLEEKSQEITLLQLLFGSATDVALFAGAIVFMVLSSWVTIQLPGVVGNFIDVFKGGGGNISFAFAGSLISPTQYLAILFTSKAVLNFSLYTTLSCYTERMCERVKSMLFTHIIKMDMAVFDETRTGELLDRISGDIEEFRAMVKHTIVLGLRSGVTLSGSVYALVSISAKLTGGMLLAVPFMVGAGSLYGSFLRKLSRKVRDLQSAVVAEAQESISNAYTIRTFANEDYESQKYRQGAQEVQHEAFKLGASIGVFHTLSMVAMNCLVLSTLFMGEKLIEQGELTGGDLASFIMYSMRLPGALGKFSVLFGEVTKGLSASSRMLGLLNTHPQIPVRGGHVPDSTGPGKIDLKDVSFAYPSRPDIKVFQGFSLCVPSGQTTALVGPSGAGKSTIVALLERFYDPLHGEISLDGWPLRELDPSWVRGKMIGVVSQEPVLFATTIENNIRYGKPSATLEEVQDAAKIANCHNFITEFPDGYATLVGERGMSLSGGQKQRVAIARAVLKDAPVLILDEATSALDSTSEKIVQEALDRLKKGRTTIIIAHRLSTVAEADNIAVLKDGMVVEQGTHHELCRQNGEYARLVSHQLK